MDGLDLAARPRLRRSLARVDVDEDVVLCVPETGRTHHLNPAAASVWKCLDGRTTLRELASDIAAVSDWDRDGVEADLVTVVRGFGRQGLLDAATPASERADAPAAESEPAPRFVRVPPGQCTQRNDLDWAATRTVHVGRYLLGVRSGSPELDRLVAHVFGAQLVPEETAPPNYSLRLASADGTRYHRLFYRCETSVRTRSLQRLLRAIAAFLAGHADEQDPTTVQVDAVVFAYEGDAFLLPPEMRPLLPSEAALCRRGLRLLDAPTAAVDPASGELVVRPPRFPLDETAVDAAAAVEPEPDDAVPTIPPGRYPVRRLVHIDTRGQSTGPSRAALVAGMNRRVRNRDAVGPQAALSTVARLISEIAPLVVPPSQPTGDTLDALVEQRRRQLSTTRT